MRRRDASRWISDRGKRTAGGTPRATVEPVALKPRANRAILSPALTKIAS